MEQTIKREVADYTESPYAEMIPKQMELYRLAADGMEEDQLQRYMGKL